MSSNAPEPDRKTDRRVRRTREQLGGALAGLIQEKPFDSITVQDVLDRAGVARSTFYSHYRDKNDLFLSDADEFFEHVAAMPPWSRRAGSTISGNWVGGILPGVSANGSPRCPGHEDSPQSIGKPWGRHSPVP